jgi:alpha-tubulin suppressor-like RCC1 family protein
VWAWGENNAGQLGDNSGHPQSTTPVKVKLPSGSGPVVAITMGAEHAVALMANGTVWTWGGNGSGQLGDGAFGSEEDLPVQVVGVGGLGLLSQVVGVSAGGYFTAALKSDGTMLDWGSDSAGQLGDGPPAAPNSVWPVAPTGLGGRLVAIAAGTSDMYAVKADGTVWAWGDDTIGALGDGTTTPSPVTSPTRVHRLVDGSGVVHLAAGYERGAAVTSHGIVFGWGFNANGQLGDSSEIDATAPVRAVSLPKIANPALLLLIAPKISGTAIAGHTLSVSKGTWGLPATAWAYQWLRNGTAILQATHASYILRIADKGQKISARVTVSRAGYPSGRTTTKPVTVSS